MRVRRTGGRSCQLLIRRDCGVGKFEEAVPPRWHLPRGLPVEAAVRGLSVHVCTCDQPLRPAAAAFRLSCLFALPLVAATCLITADAGAYMLSGAKLVLFISGMGRIVSLPALLNLRACKRRLFQTANVAATLQPLRCLLPRWIYVAPTVQLPPYGLSLACIDY